MASPGRVFTGQELSAELAYDIFTLLLRVESRETDATTDAVVVSQYARRYHLHTHSRVTALCPPEIKLAHTRLASDESTVPELIQVLGSQPAGVVSHKLGGRLPLLSARPAVTPATLKRTPLS